MEPASLYKLLEPILYIVFFLIAFGLAQSAWLYWRQVGYKGRVHWTIMEIRVPREVLRGAKAMDQFLTSLWGLLNLRWGVKETWFDGEITRWFCTGLRFIPKKPMPIRFSLTTIMKNRPAMRRGVSWIRLPAFLKL